MAYVKATIPSEVYHLTKKENLDSILEDGKIRRFGDTECWFCESLDKMKAYMEQTVMCEGKPYYAVGGRLCYYPKFVPEDYVLLSLVPHWEEDNWYRWNQEIPPNSPKELVKAAKDFSRLKIGYRGDLAFKDAEIIDVPQFLFVGTVERQPVQTNSELQEELRQRIEKSQEIYTAKLQRKPRARYRIDHISWWEQELPDDEEYAEARKNLERCGWQMDYIITHCAPTDIALAGTRHNEADRLTDFLQEIKENAQYHY